MLIATPVTRPVWHARATLLTAAATVALHLACAIGYGFHRDELYFLAESHRLAWGFVSEPPFAPAVGWLSRMLFGDSLVGLRLWPALAGAGVAILASLVARELGGRRTAQLAAAICVSTATISLALFHLYGPTAFDQLAWAGCLFVLVKLLNGADPRWWLAFGAIAGIGLLTKNTLVFLAVALLVAVALTPQRWAWLRSPLPWLAGLLAVAVASPYLLWQAGHGWPMLTIAGSVSDEQGGLSGALLYLPMQVLTMNPLLLPVWAAGLWWLWRSRTFRPLALVWLVMLVLLALSGGRSYYLAPAYLPLFAAGGVAVERWLARPGRRVRPAAVPVALIAAAAVILPSALPVLPVEAHRSLPFTSINPVLADAIGWETYVAQLTALRAEHPDAVVLTSNYGEAGAMEVLGRERAYSGHNAYGDWGPPPAGTSEALVVGFTDTALLQRSFERCTPVATIDNGLGIDNEEQGRTIHLCAGPVAPWTQLWPSFVHVSN